MGKKTLGLYLSEDYLTGVVTELSGKARGLSAFAQVSCQEGGPLFTPLDELLRQLDWQDGEVICGLPLSWISVRNLELPFRDKKSITQTLPFELDDQLIPSIDELVSDFTLLDTVDTNSRILSYSLEKEKLAETLAYLKSYGLEPAVVLPAVSALASAAGTQCSDGQVLFLRVDASACSVSLLRGGVCQFCRHLPFSDQSLVNLYGDDLELRRKNLVASLRRSLGFLRTIGFAPEEIQKICVSGQLINDQQLGEYIATSLDLPLQRLSLAEILGSGNEILVEDHVGEYEAALALAFYNSFPDNTLNLRQGEFAAKRSLFGSPKQLISVLAGAAVVVALVIGYYTLDYKRLTTRNRALRTQMEQLYRQQFPNVTRVHDPYVQMQVALRGMETTEGDVPIYAGNQRILDFLADISSRIPETTVIQVSRMVVDNKAVRMRGVTETFNAVDEIKNLLAQSPYYTDVQIVSATADKKTQKIRFEIQLDLGEG
ncbi:MAG: hypothetical protein CSB34_05325 [Desulfobulbus propionicus]|nr:MAG: hypothetical protein CSB34_05325 [Desulfobulbus propionicus]